MRERIICDGKLHVQDTGQGFTTTYAHRVWTDRLGNPCPTLCFLQKGHMNQRKVYQLINDTKGFVIRSEGAEGRIRIKNNKIELWGSWTLDEIEANPRIISKVKGIAQVVFSWKSGRACHFPPLSEGLIVPEITQLESIPHDLQKPWMKGGFILSGGGQGERNGDLYISKMWKLSTPHIKDWEFFPKQTTIRKDAPLRLNGGTISTQEDDRIIIIERTLSGTNFLCSVQGEGLATLQLEYKGITKETQVGGQFRCGVILRPPKEGEEG